MRRLLGAFTIILNEWEKYSEKSLAIFDQDYLIENNIKKHKSMILNFLED